jgi:hypothetical protein
VILRESFVRETDAGAVNNLNANRWLEGGGEMRGGRGSLGFFNKNNACLSVTNAGMDWIRQR